MIIDDIELGYHKVKNTKLKEVMKLNHLGDVIREGKGLTCSIMMIKKQKPSYIATDNECEFVTLF